MTIRSSFIEDLDTLTGRVSTLESSGVPASGNLIGTNVTYAGTGTGTFAFGKDISIGTGDDYQVIGENITMPNGTQRTVLIGNDLTIDNTVTRAVVMGHAIDASVNPTTGAAGGEMVVIGNGAEGRSWRNTIIGTFAKGNAVSQTAYGWGADCRTGTHNIAIGRGAVNFGSNATSIGSNSNKDLWLANGEAHVWNNHWDGGVAGFSTLAGTSTPDNASNTITFHGIDGWDQRDDNSTPDTVNGGDLAMMPGRPNGPGLIGGSFFVKIAKLGSSTTANIKGSTQDALEIDTHNTATELPMVIMDLNTGTRYRLILGAETTTTGTFGAQLKQI